ncbi:MAG: hypothetical protein JW940_22775 [Polyangiaceae bacterium]|nr:hypothetical protein [Polyangiaceae bacterium]
MLSLALAALACELNTNVVALDSGSSGRAGAGGAPEEPNAGGGGVPREGRAASGGQPNAGGGGVPAQDECIQEYGGAYCAINDTTAPEAGDRCRPEGIEVCMPTVHSYSLGGSGYGRDNRLSRCSHGRWTTVEANSSCRSSAALSCCNGWAVHEDYCCPEDEKGVYCESDAGVFAVCDGTRWHEQETPAGSARPSSGGAGGVPDGTGTDRGGGGPTSSGPGGAPEETSAGRGAGGVPGDECTHAEGGAYCATYRATAPEPGDSCEPEGIEVCVPTTISDNWGGHGPVGEKRRSRCSGGQWKTLEEDSSCSLEDYPEQICCNGWAVHQDYCCEKRGAYCLSDAEPPVLAVCDGTRWHVLSE